MMKLKRKISKGKRARLKVLVSLSFGFPREANSENLQVCKKTKKGDGSISVSAP